LGCASCLYPPDTLKLSQPLRPRRSYRGSCQDPAECPAYFAGYSVRGPGHTCFVVAALCGRGSRVLGGGKPAAPQDMPPLSSHIMARKLRSDFPLPIGFSRRPFVADGLRGVLTGIMPQVPLTKQGVLCGVKSRALYGPRSLIVCEGHCARRRSRAFCAAEGPTGLVGGAAQPVVQVAKSQRGEWYEAAGVRGHMGLRRAPFGVRPLPYQSSNSRPMALGQTPRLGRIALLADGQSSWQSRAPRLDPCLANWDLNQ